MIAARAGLVTITYSAGGVLGTNHSWLPAYDYKIDLVCDYTSQRYPGVLIVSSDFSSRRELTAENQSLKSLWMGGIAAQALSVG
jgi:hypothetical protein